MLQKKGQCKNEVLKSCFFRKKSYEVGLFHFFFGVCVCVIDTVTCQFQVIV